MFRYGTGRYQIHFAIEQFFQVQLHVDKAKTYVEVVIEFHENIDVTVRTGITSRHGAE